MKQLAQDHLSDEQREMPQVQENLNVVSNNKANIRTT